jgi:hypothetical protein
MQARVKPKATDDRRDFVVVPSDRAQPETSDTELTDLLRAVARHQSETSARPDPYRPALPPVPVPMVDTAFRATAGNDDVPSRGRTFGRGLMRALAALLLAAGISAAALSWQTFGFAAKKALVKWMPQWALTASLPLEKLGWTANSAPSDDATDASPEQTVASAQGAAGGNTADAAPAATATPASDSTQLQSMARALASANQEIEALKASIAELKAGQQQMVRDLAKASDKAAEQIAKPRVATLPPHPPVAARKPAPLYAPTPTPAAPPPAANRPATPYSAQASAPPPPAAAQPYVPPPIPLQPQADSALAPRPPMPVQ